MRMIKVSGVLVGLVVLSALVVAQERPMSPRGQASTQVGGSFDSEGRYTGGSWIDVTYGRPILRGRDLWVANS